MNNSTSAPFHLIDDTCFTLLVYDLLTTFGEEVEYFWSGPWSLSRVLFFLNRYLPFVAMIPTNVALFGARIPAQLIICFLPLNALTKSYHNQ
ncbi:hypothetical protein EV424DRAFT_717587 [Suillus variegatus]|nr:hypothetical protein EV424DRAFT_717587 [Suillus variegatus]